MPTLFDQNLTALAQRYPALASQLSTGSDTSTFAPSPGTPGEGRGEGTGAGTSVPLQPTKIDNLPHLLSSLAPDNNFTTPTLIAGLDDGHLEAQLQAIPCRHPALPSFRPPIYLLCSQISHLAAVLHHRDWQPLLNDPRFLLFVGPQAANEFLTTLRKNPRLPFPKFCLTIEPEILPPNTSLDQFLAPLQAEFNQRCAQLISQYPCIYRGLAASAAGTNPRLKILGLTSRYTTFLQHSMRDWLSAMRKLGHETRLLIEEADHELVNTLCHAQTCVDFQPDLILLIDHYRAEFPGLPPQIPAVMWVQDMLPNILNPAAGPKQGPLDFCLGYARIPCVDNFGYPEERFLPAVVGVNEHRFAPKAHGLPSVGLECDVCYVGHTGKNAEQLVRDQIEKSPTASKLLWDIYERLASTYTLGGYVADLLHVDQIIQQSLNALNLSIPPADFRTLANLFSLQVNYALFRHRTLEWLLDLDLNIHIYGKGWENHPQLKRFAKGVADNQKHLAAIYQAAKINLQITPHGLVHQRLFEGLCSGGFFLLRHRPGDVLERLHRPLSQWCTANQVRTDAELQQKATPEIRHIIESIHRLRGLNMFNQPHELMAEVRLSADCDFGQSAGTLFGEHYDQVAFASQLELTNKVHYYLNHSDQRQSISTAMRQIVLDRMTYTATSRRLLDFINQNQLRAAQNAPRHAAA